MALVSSNGVAHNRIVCLFASVNLPLHHEVQKFSSGTGSTGWSRKKGCKMVVVKTVVVSLSSSSHFLLLYWTVKVQSMVHDVMWRLLRLTWTVLCRWFSNGADAESGWNQDDAWPVKLCDQRDEIQCCVFERGCRCWYNQVCLNKTCWNLLLGIIFVCSNRQFVQMFAVVCFQIVLYSTAVVIRINFVISNCSVLP